MLLSFPHQFKVDNYEVRKASSSASNLVQRNSGSKFSNVLANSQQFEVLYVGKIKVYQKRAPPTFIDDTVENFRANDDHKVKFNLQAEADQSKDSLLDGSTSNLANFSSLPLSTPDCAISNDFGMRRPRSVSALTTCKEYKETAEDDCPSSSLPKSPSHLSSSGYISETSITDVNSTNNCEEKPSNVYPLIKLPSLARDENDSVFFDDNSTIQGAKSKMEDDPSTMSRPHSSASMGLCSNLHLSSSSLITNTQSLDEGGRASIMRDLKAVSHETNTTVKSDSLFVSSKTDSYDKNTPENNSKHGNVTPLHQSFIRSTSEFVDIPSKIEKQVSLPYRTRTSSGGQGDYRRSRQAAKYQNRTMLFLIGRIELCLLSPDLQQILFSKPFTYVSHCSQGVKYPDYFGFICRESSFYASETYVGYVFRCQTDQLVNEIMHTLKQAFHNAHQAYVTSRNKPYLCETCPMQWFHRLQSEVESVSIERAQGVILENLDSLPEPEKSDIMSSYEGSQVSSIQEQNDIFMRLLRDMCERRQTKHVHDDIRSPSALDHLKQKAKKSLSNSFETIMKLAQGESNDDIAGSNSHSPSPSPRRDFSFFEENTSSRPRSSTIGDVRDLQVHPGTTSHKLASARSESIPLHHSTPVGGGGQNMSPLYNIFFKLGSTKSGSGSLHEESLVDSKENKLFTPKKPAKSSERSWHRAIFSNVKATTQNMDKSNLMESIGLGTPHPPTRKHTRQELRHLWKKAINQQITLIQMEKENRRLQSNQSFASHKRMKLGYEEITPCLKETCKMWDDILKHDTKDPTLENLIRDAIKQGVPRHKRGEIWIFLSKFNKASGKILSNRANEVNLDKSYRQLLQNLTSQQHAILVDLGRTFPKHPFFAQPLGAGQLSLFNLLKAYSLFDKEVGYCQGLSFVAAVLLLHMNEDDAFEMMKYLLFHLGLREQYKPDMSALQMQLYQLTRLLYDLHPEIYAHFDNYDILPTLYAAPWFLTLFASQFPIGFVARLFDFIFLYGVEAIFRLSVSLLAFSKDILLQRKSFESIMDILRNDVPQLDVIQMERVFNQVFTLDISKPLIVYEAEYNVLQEEMMASSLTPSTNVSFEIRNSKSSQEISHETCINDLNNQIKDLKEENKLLKSQNMEQVDQLHVAQSNVHSLESSIETYKSTIKRLEDRVRSLEEERFALFDSLNRLRCRNAKTEAIQE